MAFEPTHIVPQGGIPVWSTPEESGSPTGTLAPGTEVQVGEERADWVHVTAKNGWTGWVKPTQLVPRIARLTPGPVAAAPPMTGTEPGTVVLSDRVYELATIWRRFGARLVDGLIIGVPFSIIAVALSGGADNEVTLLDSLLLAAIYAPYEILFVSRRGGTPGKLMTGVRVVSIHTAGLPLPVQAAKRWAVPTIPGLIPFIGGLVTLAVYVSITWDPARRGWHDKAAETAVIRVKR